MIVFSFRLLISEMRVILLLLERKFESNVVVTIWNVVAVVII